eukprot:gnl/TRDRNA2_/TRDRNA2_94316_c0_seq1.p1 gnl/TRDRNA2_/TRDRNA2_94316_c0~~gnl/TRDRNA2_/TRDRNA2_94316_c0_seq1.p1  ORF type:complete len:199 (+),score=25.40 gnl/TRDRNA2_/TRDRNA2_94316_c0_seq1:28-624(+)
MSLRLVASAALLGVTLLGVALLALDQRSAATSRVGPVMLYQHRPVARHPPAAPTSGILRWPHQGTRGARCVRRGISVHAAEDDDMKLIVCSGSSCTGRCRAGFDALKSFKALTSENDSADIKVEEVFCMNMCKRGPNVRFVRGGQMVTVDDAMNDVEQRRGAFQGVSSDTKVAAIWDLALDLAAGRLKGTLRGKPPVT